MAVSIKSSERSAFYTFKRSMFIILFLTIRWWTLIQLLVMIFLLVVLEQVPKFLLDSKLNFLLNGVSARIIAINCVGFAMLYIGRSDDKLVLIIIVLWLWKLEVELIKLLGVLMYDIYFLFEADITCSALFLTIFIIVQHEILCQI